jgi:hypothetical protein
MIYHVGISNTAGSVDLATTDLAGNVNWYYDPTAINFYGYGVSLVPGGTVLMLGGTPGTGPGYYDTVREIDLAGDILRQTNLNDVNAQLAALGKAPIVVAFDHDAQRLANGDTVLVTSTQKVINVNGTPTTYTGNDVIVLDKNFQVVWVWDSFDWMDTSRLGLHGEGPSDWLHANSIDYSPEDGNLILSMRAQDWVIKIDYSNGTGDGHVIWTLGAGGNFTPISSDASPWFSGQHDVRYINDNTIVLFDDGNTRRETNPNADSRGQEWILNEQTMTATLVVNADLGNYSAALGSAQMLPNGNLDFNSGFLGNFPNVVGQSIEVSPNGTINYVQQQNSLEYRSYFLSTLYQGATYTYGLLDSGFENPNVETGTSAYQYNPAYSPWSFNGTSGVAANGSSITSGNTNALEGTQVGFIQKTGSISQVVNFLMSGTYQLSLLAAQIGNNGTSNESFQVQVDGTMVATITPNGTNYLTYTTPTFNVTAGNHTISLVGIDPSGANYGVLLDRVGINMANQFSDPGFASPNVGTGAFRDFAYNPSGAPWTYSSSSGVAGNGSGFTGHNPNAPQGTQVAFLQKNGTISQVVNLNAGTYAISFYAAQRAGQASTQTFEVEVDGTVVGTFTPSGTSYTFYATNAFTVAAGTHTLTFIGLNPSGGDNTALIDAASIQQPSTNQPSDSGFATPNVGTGSRSDYAYNPSGSPCTFSSSSGVAGNGSGFTGHNPNAPEGTQVAFLQKNGTIGQAVNFTAGTYTLSFYAAQRAGQASSQTFEVEVDGTVVGTITPNGTSYNLYTTDAFTVTSGAHSVAFIGLNPNGGDNTALIDELSIQVVPPAPGKAGFVKTDTTTQGNWQGSYGSLAYNVIDNAASYPSYVTVNASGNSNYVWTTTSGDPRALQEVGSSDRVAAVWYSPTSFTVNMNLADGKTHQLALYLLDWDQYQGGRSEQVQIIDATTGHLLSSQSVTSFSTGVYLVWNVSGDIEIKINNLNSSSNAVLNGFFLDPAASPPPPATPGTGSFVKTDTTNQGNWQKIYGSQGYNVIDNVASYPSYAQVGVSGSSTYVWTTNTSDTRALQDVGSNGRTAAAWFSTSSFTVYVNLTDGQTHQLALYLLDWDQYGGGRSEQVQILDATTGSVLSTQSVSGFSTGEYGVWNVSGDIEVKITNTNSSSNAVLSGLFIDP